MEKDKNFYIIDKSVLPDVFLKVMEAKSLLENGKAKTVQDAAAKIGISRSAFYKYKDSIFPLYENSRGRTVTVAMNLDHTPGVLSDVINRIAEAGANILTINQTIPINGVANVTITIETNTMTGDMGPLVKSIESAKGTKGFKIIARE